MYSNSDNSVLNLPLSNMNKLTACALLALVGCVFAEPPSGYNYNRPQQSHGGFSGGFSSGGGGFSSGGGAFSSGGGGYRSVSFGGQTSEGQNVDPQLLEQVKQILVREESNAGSTGGFSGGHSAGISSQYGAPSPQYGVPSHSSRVVGIDLEGIRQAIQVAQYEQSAHGGGSSFGGYPSARQPGQSYGAPF